MKTDDNVLLKLENVSINYYTFPNDLKVVLTRLLQKRKIFRKTEVLKDISFELKEGEVICLSGSNGSGKSTILYALCDKIDLASGTIYKKCKPTAYLPGGGDVDPTQPGLDLLMFMAYLHGFNKTDIYNELENISNLSGLPMEIILEHPLFTYSTGMHGRLKSAFYLIFSPEVALYDEIFLGGDNAFVDFWFTQFEKKIQEKKASIIVSHPGRVWEKLSNLGAKFIVLGSQSIVYQGHNMQEALKAYDDSIIFKCHE